MTGSAFVGRERELAILADERWEAALEIAAQGLERGRAGVIVLDQLPYLVEEDPSVEGSLQTAWDRVLRRRPVLLVMIGSDLAMMDLLTAYDRPLCGRVDRQITLPPLSPAELADLAGLDAPTAFDAYLVVGGFPALALTWGRARDVATFLRRELPDPTSPLVVVGERMTAAEFPPEAQARAVLAAIGAGERTFSAIVPRPGFRRWAASGPSSC